MENPNENLVPAFTAEDDIQEALIRSALEDAEIEFVIQEYHDTAYDRIYEQIYGHSRILVLEHDMEKAQSIIKDTLGAGKENDCLE
jgi:mannose/fructose/N-acetylgalactosamine-specific phosphotransferase system component IIB